LAEKRSLGGGRTPLEADLLRLLVIAAAVVVIIAVATSGRFFSTVSFSAMAFQFPELGVFSLAIMLSLITGGIDLSIVSTANLSGILAALVLTRLIPGEPTAFQMAFWLTTATAVALATGWICGYVNGLLIARVGITPILATLGTMQLYMGLSYVITRGPAIAGFPEPFLVLGNGSWAGLPVPLLIFVSLAVIMAVVLNRSRFGTHLFLMGTNETAARFSGIPVERMLIRTYVLCGVLSAVGGILVMAHANSAKADYGSSYLLQALLVAILGGVHPSGGFGTVTGVVIAVVSLQVLSSGFSMLRFSQFAKELVWGAFLLFIMVMNQLEQRRKTRAPPH
jgi:simple sugar transport system permease protein